MRPPFLYFVEAARFCVWNSLGRRRARAVSKEEPGLVFKPLTERFILHSMITSARLRRHVLARPKNVGVAGTQPDHGDTQSRAARLEYQP